MKLFVIRIEIFSFFRDIRYNFIQDGNLYWDRVINQSADHDKLNHPMIIKKTILTEVRTYCTLMSIGLEKR